MSGAKQLQSALEEGGKTLVPLLGGNLVDNLWGAARPAPTTAALRIHPQDSAGEAASNKIKRMQGEIQGNDLKHESYQIGKLILKLSTPCYVMQIHISQ